MEFFQLLTARYPFKNKIYFNYIYIYIFLLIKLNNYLCESYFH